MKQIIFKFLLLFLIFSIAFCNTSIVVNAEEDNLKETELFKQKVEETNYYVNYEYEIINIEALVKTNTEEGVRYTLSYNLESLVANEKRNLVFLGDQDMNLIEVLKISISEDDMTVTNLLTNTIAKTRSARSINCTTFQCTKTKKRVGFQWDTACNMTVGQSCNGLAQIPFGGAIAWLFCRGGAIVGCSVYIDKTCVKGVWRNVCPY